MCRLGTFMVSVSCEDPATTSTSDKAGWLVIESMGPGTSDLDFNRTLACHSLPVLTLKNSSTEQLEYAC